MSFRHPCPAILLCALVLLPACRAVVLEDRGPCPRLVLFEVSNAEAFDDYATVFVTASSLPREKVVGEVFTPSRDLRRKAFGFSVRETDALQGYGLIGSEGLYHQGSAWMAMQGRDYVPLFRFAYAVQLRQEETVVPVEFVKDYIGLTLQLVGSQTPVTLTVTGDTAGIDALSGTPVPGSFSCRPRQVGPGRFECHLPRPGGTDLELQLLGEGNSLRLNLYEILSRQASLTQKNLPDFTLELDVETLSLHLNVSPWEEQILTYEY